MCGLGCEAGRFARAASWSLALPSTGRESGIFSSSSHFFLLSLLENAKQKSSLSVMHSCKVYIYFWWSFRFKENWIFIWIFYCFWRFHRTLFKLGLAFISAAKCCWWWWFLFYWFPSLNFIVFGKLSSRTLITFIHLYDFFIFWNWICLHLLGKKFA